MQSVFPFPFPFQFPLLVARYGDVVRCWVCGRFGGSSVDCGSHCAHTVLQGLQGLLLPIVPRHSVQRSRVLGNLGRLLHATANGGGPQHATQFRLTTRTRRSHFIPGTEHVLRVYGCPCLLLVEPPRRTNGNVESDHTQEKAF